MTSDAPEEGVYSASQVESFDDCQRKWAWRYRDRIKRDKPSRVLGNAVHDVLAKWLSHATPIDTSTEAGRIALTGIHVLPAPKTPGLEVEGVPIGEPGDKKLFGLRVGGHLFCGVKDVQDLTRVPPLVIDHKTSKDPRRYAKTADMLTDDVQACLYAADAMVRTGSDTCDLRWVYYSTRKPSLPIVVDRRVTREQIEMRLERAVQSAQRMAAYHAANVAAIDVPPNPNACEAFGGCDYKDLCGEFSPTERIRAIMAQQSADEFLASLKRPGSVTNAINPPSTPQAVATSIPAPPPAYIPPVLDPALASVPPPPVTTPVKRGRKPALVAPSSVALPTLQIPPPSMSVPPSAPTMPCPISAPVASPRQSTGDPPMTLGAFVRALAAALRAGAGVLEAAADGTL